MRNSAQLVSEFSAFGEHGLLLFAGMCAQLSLNTGGGGSVEGTGCCAGGLGWESRRAETLRGCCTYGRYPRTPGPEIMVRGAFCKGDGSVLPGMGPQDAVPYAGAMPVAP